MPYHTGMKKKKKKKKGGKKRSECSCKENVILYGKSRSKA